MCFKNRTKAPSVAGYKNYALFFRTVAFLFYFNSQTLNLRRDVTIHKIQHYFIMDIKEIDTNE